MRLLQPLPDKSYDFTLILKVILLVVMVLSWFVYRLVVGKGYAYFLDVGEGDAILFRTVNNKTVLVDGGPDDKILNYLGRILPPATNRIDILVVSHLHADHLIGAVEVIKTYDVDLILLPSHKYSSSVTDELEALIKSKGIPVRYAVAGDSISIDSLVLRVVWPLVNELPEVQSINDTSIVLLVSSKHNNVLLTGDAELNGNSSVLVDNIRRSVGHINVVKVPHQGSKGSIDKDILNILTPSLAVISVGKNNYGHPDEEVLSILRQQNVRIARTDINGSIKFCMACK